MQQEHLVAGALKPGENKNPAFNGSAAFLFVYFCI